MGNKRQVIDCNRCKKTVSLDEAFLIQVQSHTLANQDPPAGYVDANFEVCLSEAFADLCSDCHSIVRYAIKTAMVNK